jgi:hypothetical protein
MKFQPGQSGNPAGRPPGIESQVSKWRKDIAARVPKIIDSLATLAEQGDAQAARLLFERAIPPLRATDLAAPVELPTDMAAAATAVLSALAAGDVTPDQASGIASVLASLAKVHETAALEARIAALEVANGKQS